MSDGVGGLTTLLYRYGHEVPVQTGGTVVWLTAGSKDIVKGMSQGQLIALLWALASVGALLHVSGLCLLVVEVRGGDLTRKRFALGLLIICGCWLAWAIYGTKDPLAI